MLTKETTDNFLANQAREFLVDRVNEQATREQVPLSDIERRMLMFSETMDDEPDYAASDAFDEQYDDREYEAKTVGLVKRAYAFDEKNGGAGKWKAALKSLKDSDFYLLVMAGQAGLVRAPDLPIVFKKKDLVLILALSVVAVGGGYLVFFRLHDDWTKLVGFAAWILALWGVARVGDGLD